jgi:hypothetical protein
MPNTTKLVLAFLLALTLSLFALTVTPVTTLTSDTHSYIQMMHGNYGRVPTPFRYRVVVPIVAGWLPLRPEIALRTITWVSLLVVYVLAVLECSILGIGFRASALAVVALFCSRPNLLNYYNPYLTDGMGMLILFLLSLCFITGRLADFAGLVGLGVFVRESAFFVLPAWLLTPKRWKAVLVGTVTLGLFLAPRIAFPSSLSYASYLFSGIAGKFSIHWLDGFAKGLILSWYALWVPFAFGIWQLPRRIHLLAGSLGLGALASCLVIQAGDYERMLSVLSPVFVPVVALVIEKARTTAVFFFVGTLPLQFAFGGPYVLQQLPRTSYHALLGVTVMLSVAASTCLIALRDRRRIASDSRWSERAGSSDRYCGPHPEESL